MQFLCCGSVDRLIGTLETDCCYLNNVVVAWQRQSQLALRFVRKYFRWNQKGKSEESADQFVSEKTS